MPGPYALQDGSIRDVLIGSSVLFEDGRFIHTRCVTRDVTEQKRAEEQLREREERYELVVAGAEAAIWDWDVPAKRVLFSPRWKELRGLSDAEVTDHEEEWSKRIHPDDFERVMASLQAHFEGRTPVFAEEYRIRHKDGCWLWVLDRGIARRDADGQVIRMAGSETDITQRKRAEEDLREQKENVQTLLETLPVAVLIAHDRECLRISGNRAAAELLRMEPDANFSKSAPSRERPSHPGLKAG